VIKNGQKLSPGVLIMISTTVFVSDLTVPQRLSLSCDPLLVASPTACLSSSSPGVLFSPKDDGEDEEWDEEEDDDDEDEDDDWEDEDDDDDYDEDEDDEEDDEDWEDEEDDLDEE